MVRQLAQSFGVGTKTVSVGGAPFVIAEAGSNFNQSLDTAYRLIDVAVEAGADAVKFQLFRADVLCTPGTDGYEIFKSVELDPDWVGSMFAHAEAHGIQFMASAFDRQSVDVLDAVGVSAHKVASSEATNLPLVAHMASKGRPIFLSTGMCDMVDVHEAVSVCLAQGNDQVAILQCGALYPLPPEKVNLRVMDTLAAAFGGPVGFSDHTLGVAAAIASVGRGGSVVEKHFTLDRSAKGPDHFYALEPAELVRLVADLREAHSALGSADKSMLAEEREHGRRMGLYAARDVAAGAAILPEDISVKRPAVGLRSRYLTTATGARARQAIVAGQPLTWDNLTWAPEETE